MTSCCLQGKVQLWQVEKPFVYIFLLSSLFLASQSVTHSPHQPDTQQSVSYSVHQSVSVPVSLVHQCNEEQQNAIGSVVRYETLSE